MPDFFTLNCDAFQSHPCDTDALSPMEGQSENLQKTSSGKWTLKFQGRSIHSSYDPVKEAAKFAENISAGDRIFLYGFGLGYHVHAILEKIGPAGKLLVLELNPEILSTSFSTLDHSALARDTRFELIFGIEETVVAEILSDRMNGLGIKNSDSGLKVLFHAPSFQSVPDGFPALTNALEVLQIEKRLPAVFGSLEQENFHQNKEIIASSEGFLSLKNHHRGKPAILISAGPSLEDALPFIPRLRKQVVLGCVDTALPFLTREGLAPDYIFTLDPQEESFTHFREEIPEGSGLIFTATANSKVVQHFPGQRWVIFKEDHSLAGEFGNLPKEKGTTKAGGSVACLGLDCLIQMGCNPVVLAGQDCAFSGNRAYSQSGLSDEIEYENIPMDQTTSDLHKGKTRHAKSISVEGYHGQSIPTSQVMYSYLRTLEQIAAANPDTRLFNWASHGAMIEGVDRVGTFSELVPILKTPGG